MIQHVVALNLLARVDREELVAVMDGLAGLDLQGFVGFAHGPNRDFENKSRGYPYGFICTFTDADALARYATDPDHRALGARLVALCNDGAAGIMVFDFDTEGAA